MRCVRGANIDKREEGREEKQFGIVHNISTRNIVPIITASIRIYAHGAGDSARSPNIRSARDSE